MYKYSQKVQIPIEEYDGHLLNFKTLSLNPMHVFDNLYKKAKSVSKY